MACCFVELIISSSASYPSTSYSVSATGRPVNGSSFDKNKQVVSTTVTTVKVLITAPKKFNSNLQLALLLEPKNTSKVASGA